MNKRVQEILGTIAVGVVVGLITGFGLIALIWTWKTVLG